MLRASIFFLVLAIIAGIFGFTTIAGGAAVIAKVLFFLFLAIWIVLLIAGVFIVRKVSEL